MANISEQHIETKGPRIAILGGSFDPPHNGHALIISTLLNSGLVDELWLVPSGARPDKESVENPTHRLKMTELLVEELFNGQPVRVVAAQLDGTIPTSFTSDLIRWAQKGQPRATFYFVIGSDLLSALPTWRDQDFLKDNVTFIVIRRPGAPLITTSPFKILELPGQLCEISISSSGIRSIIKRGLSYTGYLSPKVAAYIRERKMYG